ncbi:MAG TPA: hypothetical protein VI997_02910, partial [Candidatus Thermoplasmatota archaeon]|nr:hypothetical protein [Candidatus Thermoplasmatota archaeon]
ATGVAAVLGAAWWTAAHASSLPIHVSYPKMLGLALVALALVGACAVLLRPSTGGLLALGLVAVAWPVTVMGSWKWYFPHRTMVYLAAGAGILAAPAVEAAVRAIVAIARRALARAGPALRSVAARPAPLAVAVALALVLPTGAAMHATTPNAYVWDRYYPDDEFPVLDRLAHRLDAADGDLVVVVGSWVPNAWLNAMLDVDRAAFRDIVFRADDRARESELDAVAKDGGTVLVLLDTPTRDRADRKGWDLDFLDGWPVVDEGGDATVYRRPLS